MKKHKTSEAVNSIYMQCRHGMYPSNKRQLMMDVEIEELKKKTP